MATSIATWNQIETDVEAKFWEINVPDFQELSRLRIFEWITYKAQATGQARDLSDFLSEESFPQIQDLGGASKQTL